MKKIFSFFATALVALFGLTCCGGGGSGSEPGYMSIEDFAAGTKKFVTGYGLVMEIVPTPGDGDYTPQVTDTKVSFMPGYFEAGDTRIEAALTYWMDEPDARTAYLQFSLIGDVEDLTEKNFLAGLGFATLATDEAAGTTIILPNTITSLSGMNCTLEFNFDAQQMQTTARFVNMVVNADGKTTIYEELVQNGTTAFAVYPQ